MAKKIERLAPKESDIFVKNIVPTMVWDDIPDQSATKNIIYSEQDIQVCCETIFENLILNFINTDLVDNKFEIKLSNDLHPLLGYLTNPEYIEESKASLEQDINTKLIELFTIKANQVNEKIKSIFSQKLLYKNVCLLNESDISDPLNPNDKKITIAIEVDF